ncbi:MAG: hypothetical protein KAR37_06035, partial [Alphaproteobacteria bacterium]|nr:hypothetical protein [Alphaproteobacteria bacterium]
IYEGHEALCIHNPATGREATMPQVVRPSDGPKCKIVVVGAGPAGLEAARNSGDSLSISPFSNFISTR